MKKQVLFTFILAIVATMWTGTVQAQIQEYGAWIAGVQITSDNCNDLSVIPSVTGKAKYDPSENAIVLENATIKTSGKVAIEVHKNLGLKVIGKCKIESDTTAIRLTSFLEIYSNRRTFDDQCLDVIGGDTAISMIGLYGTLTVRDCTVNAKATTSNGVGISGRESVITIEDDCARFTAEGKGGSIRDLGNIRFRVSYIMQPKRAKFDEELKCVTLNGELVKTKVVIESVTFYPLRVGSDRVHSGNCDDLTQIEDVKGKAYYDPNTKTLTLDNVTIKALIGRGIANFVDDLTIRLIGKNTIIGNDDVGIENFKRATIVGVDNAFLKVAGGETGPSITCKCGIRNVNTITVRRCTIEATGGVHGLREGNWEFDHCTVRARGGYNYADYAGSISHLYGIPKFIGCKITSPEGTYWKDFLYLNEYNYYSLLGADDKPVIDWVTIEELTGIDTPNADTATKQGIYTLSGVRLQGELNDLPKGVYIVNGQKVVKQ